MGLVYDEIHLHWMGYRCESYIFYQFRHVRVQKIYADSTPVISLCSISTRYFVGLVRGDGISKKKHMGAIITQS